MKKTKPANKPAKQNKYTLKPFLPGKKHIGPLKDRAQEIIAASAGLEGRVAKETAEAIGTHLRLINSYYSNLIEGHKTNIPDIEMALAKNYHQDLQKQYAQELCAAHVETENQFIEIVKDSKVLNICETDFLSDLHAAFYRRLPKPHLFTHTDNGFSDIPVQPGKIRDLDVSVDGRSIHGPEHHLLPGLLKIFADAYSPENFHGDERLIAMAAAHHRLTWLHPFRDGNGRVARLFSGIYLVYSGINRANLWSLCRGLSREKNRYMFELWATDSPEKKNGMHFFNEELLADFCDFLLAVCLDQIRFMENLLRLDQIESRIDWYVETRSRQAKNPLRPESAKLLRAVFMRGTVVRGKVPEILNMSERTSRRVVSDLIQEGLLASDSHRAPLTIGLPLHALPYYFPDLYDPAVIGEEYMDRFKI